MPETEKPVEFDPGKVNPPVRIIKQFQALRIQSAA
jgi:hypothetical protein